MCTTETSQADSLHTLRQWLNLIFAGGGLTEGGHSVFIVGTCRDAFGTPELVRANTLINSVVETSPCRGYIQRNRSDPDVCRASGCRDVHCFFVDNTKGQFADHDAHSVGRQGTVGSAGDGALQPNPPAAPEVPEPVWAEHDSVTRLRAAIEDETTRLPTAKELVPVRWLELLEQFEVHAKEEGVSQIALEDVHSEARLHGFGADAKNRFTGATISADVSLEDEVGEMLRYFMNIGLIVYHGNHPELSNVAVLQVWFTPLTFSEKPY